MTDLRKAAEMALEALHNIDQSNNYDAIEALRQALAQPEQEPVGWLNANEGVDAYAFTWRKKETHDIPLYTAPPKREWVGLTDDDKREFAAAQYGWEDLLAAADAKLKEKNT